MKKIFKAKNTIQRKSSTSRKKQETAISGWNACISLFETRPQDIFRVYFSKERSAKLQKIKRWCADRKIPYRQLNSSELARAASSIHHEGVVMVTRPMALKSTLDLLNGNLRSDDLLIALDGVSNTHNLGAILRTAAFFGIKGLVAGRNEEQANLTPSAIRMAEGALEKTSIYDCRNISSFLRDIKKLGVSILGAEPTAEKPLYEVSLKLPCVLVIGNEGKGLSKEVKRRCDNLVHIPGSGKMQSLNVSVATGIFLNALFIKKIKRMNKK